MLEMSLELKTMALLRNGSLLSVKRSITDQELAEPAVIIRLPLFLCLLLRLMLISLDPHGKRTQLSSTDGLFRPQVVHGMILQCLNQVLTVVSVSVTVSSTATGQVISTLVSVVAAAVTGLVITLEGLVITPEGLVTTLEGLVITLDRVITLDQVITTLDPVIIHGQVISQDLRMMIMVLEILQALSCTHQVLQQTKTGTGCRGTLRSIV